MSKHRNDRKSPEKLSDNVTNLHGNSELDKMNPLTYQEIKESNPPPLEYIIYPWLPTQGIAFIYAATGVGKTMFTLNVAYCAASGGNFLKYKSIKPRKVLYVDGEMAYSQIHKRFMDVINQQGELDHPENWYLLTPDKAIFKLPHICTLEGQEYYSKKIKQLGIELLVLDNLSTLSSIDENNSEQWKIIQDWLISLRKKGISIIIVHHSGKEKRGYRGTSRMLDCVDTAISLQDLSQSDFENEISNGKKFKISYQKNRSFGGQDAIEFEVNLTSSGWHYESIEKTNLVRIAEMFNNKMRQVNIAREMKVDESYVSRMVRKAKDLKMIRD